MTAFKRSLTLVTVLAVCLALSACIGGGSPANKSSLEREITRAENLKAATPEGSLAGQAPASAHAALQGAIEAAKAVAAQEEPAEDALRSTFHDLRKAIDDFNQAIVRAIPIVEEITAPSADVFLSASYKSLPNDATKPLYVRTGGNIIVGGGNITLEGGRFTIGMPEGHPPTSASESPAGTLDLSRPYRITIEVLSTSKRSGNTKFQVYVDNNTTSAGNSIHSSVGSTASRIYSEDVGNIAPGTLVITSDLGTPNSFLQFRTESAATITIGSFKIEYQ